MNNKISLLLPTRGRPLLVKRLFRSIIEHTADVGNLEIILYLDEDDKESHSIEEPRLIINKKIGPRSTMGFYNTKCLEASSGDIIMLMNDDLVILTPGWDNIIKNFALTIPDDIFLAYPDDMEGAKNSTFPILSRKACEILSRPYPIEYESLYIDTHIFDIFTRLKYLGQKRIFFLDNVVFDHRHFINGKKRPDANYSHKNRFQDSMTFISLRHLRQLSAHRLLASIKNESLLELPGKSIIELPPNNLYQAVVKYYSIFLKDYGLPLTCRLLWFVRFTKYYAAMKSGIGFLKRKSYILYGSG